jgi:hypothetical protein
MIDTSEIELVKMNGPLKICRSVTKQIKSNMFRGFSWTNQLYNVKMGIGQLKITYNNACFNQWQHI